MVSESLGQAPGDGAVCKDTLNRHAHLASMIEAALCELCAGHFEIGIACDDHRRSAPVFKRASRTRGQLRPEHPTHPRGSDEAEEADTCVADQCRRDVVRFGHERLAPLGGKSRLPQES